MKQTNSSFLSGLNLAVTDKFQNTRVLCLYFFICNENICSNICCNFGSSKKTQMNPLNNRHANKKLPGTT